MEKHVELPEPDLEFALFCGAGGGVLGGIIDGRKCIGAVEYAKYPRSVLLARQRDGMLPWFPCWDDVRSFRYDNPACTEYIQYLRSVRHRLVISGGFPCTDISVAGKGAGIEGEHSGLWSEMARIIGEVQPRFAFVENSPMLTSRGLDVVLGDLSTLGYNAVWGTVSAADAGAPHRRERIWILAHAVRYGRESCNGRKSVQDGDGDGTPHATGRTKFEQRVERTSEHPIGQLADTNGTTQRRGCGEFPAQEGQETERSGDGSGGGGGWWWAVKCHMG